MTTELPHMQNHLLPLPIQKRIFPSHPGPLWATHVFYWGWSSLDQEGTWRLFLPQWNSDLPNDSTCRGDLAGWPLQKKLVAWWGPTSSSMFRDWLWLHSLCTPRSKKAEGISKTPSTLLFAAFSYGSAGFQAGYIHIGYAKHLVNQVQTLAPPNELSHKMQVLDSLSAFFRRGALP